MPDRARALEAIDREFADDPVTTESVLVGRINPTQTGFPCPVSFCSSAIGFVLPEPRQASCPHTWPVEVVDRTPSDICLPQAGFDNRSSQSESAVAFR